jgi:hypothetical protein
LPLLSAAVELLGEHLDSVDTFRFVDGVQPERLRKDLKLYHQDLRMLVHALDDGALIAIQDADPDAAARILAHIGDLVGAVEERQVASAGAAMSQVGGLLAKSAQTAGITVPGTVFVPSPVPRVTADVPAPRPSAWRRLLRRAADASTMPFSFVGLLWGAWRGKSFPFDTPDDLSSRDRYATGEPFGRRVFISFERSSAAIADLLEDALKKAGLEPYRYQQGKALALTKPRYTIAEFRAQFPGVGEEIVRTVRRSSAVVFIVSEAWTRSPLCEVEALATKFCFYPFGSGVYAVIEPGTQLPELLSGARVVRYRPGIETSLAEELVRDVDQLARFRSASEERRRRLRSG